MPIDLDGLALIDSLLDWTLELCFLTDTWTEKELQMLNKLHKAVLYMNRLWMEEDAPSAQFIHDIKSPLAIANGYLDLLEMEISAEKLDLFKPRIEMLQRHINLLRQKVDFMLSQIGPYCQL